MPIFKWLLTTKSFSMFQMIVLTKDFIPYEQFDLDIILKVTAAILTVPIQVPCNRNGSILVGNMVFRYQYRYHVTGIGVYCWVTWFSVPIQVPCNSILLGNMVYGTNTGTL